MIRGTGKRRFDENDTTEEGDFENERLKYGKRTWPNGDTYVGAFDKNGDIDGKGVFTWANGWKYDGEYKDGLRNGFGVFTAPDGSVYEGQFKNDKKHKGTLTSPDGSVYNGRFKNDKKHGRGHLTLSDGTVLIGQFNQDRPPIHAQDAFLSGEDTD